MENSPSGPDDKAKDERKQDKKKKGSILGGMVTEPKHTKPEGETADDIWAQLSLTKRKGGETQTVVPLVELDQPEITRVPEADEQEAPLDHLSPAEEQVVAREVVADHRQSKPEQVDQSDEDIAAPAIEAFRQKITEGGQAPAQAFAETLDELNVPTPPSEQAPRHQEPLELESEAATESHDITPTSEQPPQPIPEAPDSGRSGRMPPAPPIHFAAPNTAPIVPLPTNMEQVPNNEAADTAGAFFMAGIVGYLIGRRRGRIKTRKKLLPVQKKLEAQVTQLQQDIQRKELYIREAAREQTRDRQKASQMEQNRKSENTRAVALEANQLHGKVAPESIGRVLITADETQPATPGKAPQKVEASREALLGDKKVATLSRNELLELSSRVKVENTTLRRVYETHLVSEQGLRRLIDEYLRGGDVQKAFRQELVEHEIDFERDPVLRDQDRSTPSDTAGIASPTLGKLLQKAGVSEGEPDAKFTAQAKLLYDHDQRKDHARHRRFIDISLVAIIFILLLLVIILVMGRQ